MSTRNSIIEGELIPMKPRVRWRRSVAIRGRRSRWSVTPLEPKAGCMRWLWIPEDLLEGFGEHGYGYADGKIWRHLTDVIRCPTNSGR